MVLLTETGWWTMPSARIQPGARAIPGYVTQSLRITVLAALVVGALSGALFIINGIFLAVRDLVIVLMAASLTPVAWTLHTRIRQDAGIGSRVAILLGFAGLVVTVVGSLDGLAATLGPGSLTGVDPLTGQGVGLGLVGLWLVLHGLLGRRHGHLDGRTATAAGVGGIGFVAFGLLAVTSGFTPALPVTGAVGLLGFIAWGVWLGRRLRTGTADRMAAPLA